MPSHAAQIDRHVELAQLARETDTLGLQARARGQGADAPFSAVVTVGKARRSEGAWLPLANCAERWLNRLSTKLGRIGSLGALGHSGCAWTADGAPAIRSAASHTRTKNPNPNRAFPADLPSGLMFASPIALHPQ
jgi:hypothetical protein